MNNIFEESIKELIKIKNNKKHPMINKYPWYLRPIKNDIITDDIKNSSEIRSIACDNGLFSNVLQLLDAALLAEILGKSLSVDWIRKPSFSEFTYGEFNQDIFASLFEKLPLIQESNNSKIYHFNNRINPLLLAPSRGLYPKTNFYNKHRLIYSEILKKTFKLLPNIQEKINFFTNKFDEIRKNNGKVFGVHCRLTLPPVILTQSQNVISGDSDKFIDLLKQNIGDNDYIFLATDSTLAYDKITKIFPNRCIVQNQVKREIDKEVHYQSGTIEDAVNVLVDTWVLASCDKLFHNCESNIILAASFINTNIETCILGTTEIKQHDLYQSIYYEDEFDNIDKLSNDIEWTLIISKKYKLRENFKKWLIDIEYNLQNNEIVLFQTLNSNGSIFPEISDLSNGIVKDKISCIVKTKKIKYLYKLKNNVSIQDLVYNILYSATKENNLRIFTNSQLADEINFFNKQEINSEDKLLLQLIIDNLFNKIISEDAWEKEICLLNNTTESKEISKLLSLDKLINTEYINDISKTRNRLVHLDKKYSHCAAFYAGGFYLKVDNPEGIEYNKTFNSKVIKDALDRKESISWKHSEQWSVGASIVQYILQDKFKRRVNVNTYITKNGNKTSFAAHNDPHCFIILQLHGNKRWRLWKTPKYFLPITLSYKNEHIAHPDQRYGFDGKLYGEDSIEIKKLGTPDLDITLSPGDIMYVPRGTIHLTSTVIDDTLKNSDEYSVHFTAGIPVDFQTMENAIGVDQYREEYFVESIKKAISNLQLKSSKHRYSYSLLDKDYKEKIRNNLHNIINEMVDNTDYISKSYNNIEYCSSVAINNSSIMDPNIK